MIDIHAEEVRQYLYCKRIIYFRRVIGFKGRESFLMSTGTKYHAQKGERSNEQNDVYLYSNKLGIGAKIDLISVNGECATIRELKRFKNSPPSLGHLLQLTVEGMLVEEILDVKKIELVITYHGGSEYTLENYNELKVLVIEVVKEMREVINKELIPPPTKSKEKCKVCEFWKICLQS